MTGVTPPAIGLGSRFQSGAHRTFSVQFVPFQLNP